MHCRLNGKAWVDTALLKERFDSCFVPEVKGYCKENIPFKILLLVGIAPGHPGMLNDLHIDF